MKRPVNLGIATLKALGAFVVLGAVAHASLPYLPLVGPPPLRLQTARSPANSVVKFASNPKVVATNLPAIADANLPRAVTNASVSNSNSVSNAIDLNLLPVVVPDKSLGDTFASSVFTLPTPDLLGITPQMLATYFRPVQLGTNAPFVGPFRVSFIPPLPPEKSPDKSSHAEYILK